MNIDWQDTLYPLGFIATIAFFSRFAVQWLASEYQGKSIVTRHFWIISLVGNIALLIHSLIQQQFHVSMVQTSNSVISWRNLNLLGPEEKKYSLQTTLVLFIFSLSFTLTVFISGSVIWSDSFSWFRIPNFPWSTSSKTAIPLYVHLIGTLGILIFGSRFWIQWWLAERCQESHLGKTFWILSLAGSILSIYYFLYIFDPVNFIGPIFGIIPCIRNLMLIDKEVCNTQ